MFRVSEEEKINKDQLQYSSLSLKQRSSIESLWRNGTCSIVWL